MTDTPATSTKTGKALAPMETFMERVKGKLRDDIGNMLPDEAVTEMVKRVIDEEFFTKKRIPDPTDRSSYTQRMIDAPSEFQKMVLTTALPIMEKHALLVAERHAAEIEAQIKQSIEDGLITMALKSLDKIFSQALEGNAWNIQNAIENNLRSKGLVR